MRQGRAGHPDGTEVPCNRIDEDCDGADLIDFDRDKDGLKRPLDCNDADARVHPGTPEVPGNKVDEDCDGKAEPFPSLAVRLVYGASFARAAVRKLCIVAVWPKTNRDMNRKTGL